MLNNADQVEQLLQTNGKGAKAQVGYDLTLKEVKQINGGAVFSDKTVVHQYTPIAPFNTADTSVDQDGAGRTLFALAPGTYSLTFEQGIKLPTNKTAFIRHRSSILRCGSVITSGIFDPGFEVDEMGAVMITTQPITIEKGARVAQVYIFDNNEADAYNGQWQSTKDKK
jgi:deoxycytidine triphosphate deaminase